MYMQLLWCKAASCGKVAWKETKVIGILRELQETLFYKLNTVEVAEHFGNMWGAHERGAKYKHTFTFPKWALHDS